jgi:hypothetical protein
MNDDFLKARAREVRSIANKADPFIKKRLLDLAEGYEGRVGRPSRGTTRLAASQNEIH